MTLGSVVLGVICIGVVASLLRKNYNDSLDEQMWNDEEYQMYKAQMMGPNAQNLPYRDSILYNPVGQRNSMHLQHMNNYQDNNYYGYDGHNVYDGYSCNRYDGYNDYGYNNNSYNCRTGTGNYSPANYRGRYTQQSNIPMSTLRNQPNSRANNRNINGF